MPLAPDRVSVTMPFMLGLFAAGQPKWSGSPRSVSVAAIADTKAAKHHYTIG
jgi:hypothetical protein